MEAGSWRAGGGYGGRGMEGGELWSGGHEGRGVGGGGWRRALERRGRERRVLALLRLHRWVEVGIPAPVREKPIGRTPREDAHPLVGVVRRVGRERDRRVEHLQTMPLIYVGRMGCDIRERWA